MPAHIRRRVSFCKILNPRLNVMWRKGVGGLNLNLFSHLADLLYPRICPGCGRPVDRPGRSCCWSCFSSISLFTESLCERCGGFVAGKIGHEFLCGACLSHLPAFERARAAGCFTGLLRTLLHDYKYHGALWLTPDLTDLLEGAFRAQFLADQVDLILPVPLHPFRKRERTYNQSEELARALAKRLDRLCKPDLLQRIRYTDSQTTLSAPKRRENLKGAFIAHHPEWIVGRTILLIDDVMTTGATFDACAVVLKQAGAKHIWALSVARGV